MKKLVLLSMSCTMLLTSISCADRIAKEHQVNERDTDGFLVGLDPRVKKMALEHREAVHRIDSSFANEREGDRLFRIGDYEKALVHYLKAQELTDGPKGVIMNIIAETYQKLGRYDDAIAILQESIDTNQWNEEGKTNTRALIEKYQELRDSR
jgi:tetratricopeptide (TPR) repeat protein